MATPRVVRTAAVVAVLVLALPLLLRPATPAQEVPATRSVDGVVISVGSLERAIDFYTKVLTFELVSQSEVVDEGARSRIARLRLGREAIDLVEHVAPRGRPLPADARSNDCWFQHIAIIVNDIDQAHLWLKRHGVERTSPEPQRLPDWNPNAGGIWADRRRRHGREPQALPRRPRPPGRRPQREPRPRAGAVERCHRRPASHHDAARC